MSDLQVVKLRAIDRPLTDKQLAFMEKQSSRAEITKWTFDVEYNYSSFRGDVESMLRNGYDICLEFASSYSRRVYIRLPNGLPVSNELWAGCLNADGVEWIQDKNGKGGVLTISPLIEDAGWLESDGEEYLDCVAKLREMLIAGDLRAIYFVWLCGAISGNEDPEEAMEPPVPHGLGEFPMDVAELLYFFEQEPLLVTAAGQGVPKFDGQKSQTEQAGEWIGLLSDQRKVAIIERLLKEDPVTVKAELLSEIRGCQESIAWPMESPTRMLANLLTQCDVLLDIEIEKLKKKEAAKVKLEAEKAEKERQERLAKIKADPQSWLKKATELVERRGRDSYVKAADILTDVRAALGDVEGRKIACKHAAQLAKDNPTLNILKSALRKKVSLNRRKAQSLRGLGAGLFQFGSTILAYAGLGLLFASNNSGC